MDLVVGVDMATAAVRALAMDGQGRIHARAETPLTPPVSPRPGWWEQDPTAWWPAVAATLTQLSGDLGPAAGSVRAIAVCATSGTVLLLDGRGEPCSQALTYADQRAAAEAQRAHEAAPEAWRRIGLRVQPTFGLPKWAWLLHNTEAPAGARVAHAPDVIVAKLSGPGLSGPGLSSPGLSSPGLSGPGLSGPGLSGPGLSGPGLSGPGLSGPGLSGPGLSGPGLSGPGRIGEAVPTEAVPTEAVPTDWSHTLKSGYDPQREAWVGEAMAALGIPTAALPEVRRPGAVAGRLQPAAARATGLPSGCTVRLGMTDSCASQIAAGAAAPGHASSVLGTTLVLKTGSETLIADPTGAVYSHRHPDGWWLPGGASNVGGRALRAGFPGRDLAGLDAAAARRGPANAVTYPLVGTGERFPFAEPAAEPFWLGEPADETERYRALLEGVAFAERLGYERLAGLGAGWPSRVAASGGGAASRMWNRIRAATLGVPLIEVPGASTARGACILAAAGSLHADLASATVAMRAYGPEVSPDEEDGPALQASYERLLTALKERGWVG